HGLTVGPLLDDDDDGAIGTKAPAIGSPRQLRIFTLGLSEDARRNDTGTDEVIAHGRRALARKLEVGILLADRVGVAEQPDVGVAAFPRLDQLIEGGAAVLVHPGLVEAELHDISPRRILGGFLEFDGHTLGAEAQIETLRLG